MSDGKVEGVEPAAQTGVARAERSGEDDLEQLVEGIAASGKYGEIRVRHLGGPLGDLVDQLVKIGGDFGRIVGGESGARSGARLDRLTQGGRQVRRSLREVPEKIGDESPRIPRRAFRHR